MHLENFLPLAPDAKRRAHLQIFFPIFHEANIAQERIHLNNLHLNALFKFNLYLYAASNLYMHLFYSNSVPTVSVCTYIYI